MVRRLIEQDKEPKTDIIHSSIISSTTPSTTNDKISITSQPKMISHENKPIGNGFDSGVAWRQQQKMNISSFSSIIQQMYEREHAH